MKQLSGKHLCQLAEQEGWELKRINGSHYIYGKEGKVERLSIPVHGNTPLKIGLLKSLLKIMGIDESSL
ncbi:MAG: type II toxin-antitoxin system HicA family toxin [Sphingobacteriales bacterium]|mgnify:CR=1 FL=1|jgi:predicted RNA binding protein YcfA (HicA-like mRNA interferase family)|nr:type II toxin-antitoxin system HicA family toxin [Sphingobacteriales bacterium]